MIFNLLGILGIVWDSLGLKGRNLGRGWNVLSKRIVSNWLWSWKQRLRWDLAAVIHALSGWICGHILAVEQAFLGLGFPALVKGSRAARDLTSISQKEGSFWGSKSVGQASIGSKR